MGVSSHGWASVWRENTNEKKKKACAKNPRARARAAHARALPPSRVCASAPRLDPPVEYFHKLCLVRVHAGGDQGVVDADLAKLVLNDGEAQAVRLPQDAVQQRRLARAQESGEDGDGDAGVFRRPGAGRHGWGGGRGEGGGRVRARGVPGGGGGDLDWSV